MDVVAVVVVAAIVATVVIVDVDPLFEELSLNNDWIIFKCYLVYYLISLI